MSIGENKPVYKDVSHDGRSWEEVVPDQYWGPEHCMGKEVVLQIGSIQLEQYGDDLPRAVLVFTNDKKWLRVSRDSRQTLKELFGTSPSEAIGKWITITAGPNQMKTIVVKILPRQTAPPVAQAAGPQMSPEQYEAFLKFKASQQSTTAS
ncbi:hypothetical protein [Schlesneria sp. T3-172]|uniref:hypothetical protein n=1 Tax=Schlesneria sphaerica TaxID=3373610 RepID=UPI0037C926CA